MARKRIVDAENHLLTGGLVTGFLTFMGFLPGAAASAVITGSLVHKDVQKAKKEEAFERDFAAHQERTEKGRARAQEEVWDMAKYIDALASYGFEPNSDSYKRQEELEKAFNGANVERVYRNKLRKRRQVSEKEIINLASKTDSDKKIVEITYEKYPREFILVSGDEEIYTTFYTSVPYNLRKKCSEWGVPFRKHSYKEVETIKAQIAQKIFAPYKFDYSRYR